MDPNEYNLQTDEDEQQLFDWWEYHFYVNLVCWGMLTDVGILILKYGKNWTYKIEIHGIIMTFIIFVSLLFESLMSWTMQSNFHQFRSIGWGNQMHMIIGLSFMGLILIQLIGGVLLRLNLLSNQIQNNLSTQVQFHRVMGHLLYIIGKFNVGVGYYLSFTPDSQLIGIFWFVYALIFFWRFILEYIFITGYSFYKSNNLCHQTELISQIECDQENFKLLWVLFNNQVIDLTGFQHPGGQFIINRVRGREVSSFIYGAYQLECTKMKPYTHSHHAHQIIQQRTIGTLTPKPFYNNFPLPIWTLTNVKNLQGGLAYFGFTNTSEVKMKVHFDYNTYYGQYFVLQSADGLSPIRNYTMIMAITEVAANHRQQLLNFILNKAIRPFELQEYTEELPLVIKNYQRGFSQYIHLRQSNRYIIQGPFFTPFGVRDKGQIIIVCGGTGLLPFLDYLDSYLRNTVDIIDQKKESHRAITMFLAIQSELVGEDILFALLQIQQFLLQPNFKLIIRSKQKIEQLKQYSELTTENFNSELFRKHIDNPTKILICGPPGMNSSVPEEFKKLGINESCQQSSLQLLKEIDQFGAIFRPTIKLKSSEYKTLLGGIISIVIYGLSFAYFVYGIQQWASDQILPTIAEFKQIIDVIDYKSSDPTVLLQPRINKGQIDPFDSQNLVLMAVNYKFSNGFPSSNMSRFRQKNGQINIDELDLSIDNRNNNQTNKESFTFLTSCLPELLDADEKCAHKNITQQFWNQSNVIGYKIQSQQYNTKSRQLKKLSKQFYVLYSQDQTFYNNLYLQTTLSSVDEGLLFSNIKEQLFVSEINQQSQAISIQQAVQLSGIPIYMAFAIRMDTLQSQQNIAYPNISGVLASIGSIISSLLFFSYIAILINKKSLEDEAILDVIKMYFPEFNDLQIKKNLFGRIKSIQNTSNQLYFDVKDFQKQYQRLVEVAQQKLCISNQIYEISRLQFGMQQLLSKDELLKLRDKNLQLSLKPHKIEHHIVKQPSFSQIAPVNDSRESRIIEVNDKNDEEFDQKHDHNSEFRSTFKDADKNLIPQERLKDPTEYSHDESDFDLLCIKRYQSE